MTVSPWSDAARALVGAAFGDPTLRNDADKIDLQRQQVQQDAKRLLLEEAFNPARISQAEAAARYSNSQADTEDFKLGAQRDFLSGPGPGYAMPPTSPVAGDGNPAASLPYDQIVPKLSEEDLFGTGPTSSAPVAPPQAPVELTFDQVLNELTAPQAAAQPAPVMASPAPVAAPQQGPMTLDQLLTPEVRTMMAAGYLPETSLPDLLLAAEGQRANTGVTSPTQRLQNTAAGAGTFISPDQLAASTMGNNIPAADLAQRGFDAMLPTSIQEFNYGQENPGFMAFVNSKNAGPNLSVTYDANGKPVISYGKDSGTKLTEAQSRAALFATRASQAGENLDKVLASPYGQNLGTIDLTNAADYMAGMSKPESPAGALVANAITTPEGRQMYQAANSFLTAIVRPDSGAALTPDEWLIYGRIFLPMPGDDQATLLQKAQSRKTATLALKAISNGGADQIVEMLAANGAPVPAWLDSAAMSGSMTPGTPPTQAAAGGPPTIDTQEEWNNLAPGTTYIDKQTGQTAVK